MKNRIGTRTKGKGHLPFTHSDNPHYSSDIERIKELYKYENYTYYEYGNEAD